MTGSEQASVVLIVGVWGYAIWWRLRFGRRVRRDLRDLRDREDRRWP